MGRQLGIEFSSIFMDFGTQVGMQNRAKIVQKWHRKNDEKTNKFAVKLLNVISIKQLIENENPFLRSCIYCYYSRFES